MARTKIDPTTTAQIEANLRQARTEYQAELDRIKQLRVTAGDTFGAAIRDAHQAGMRKSDILRAIDHEWSRTWIDKYTAD